ncbi:MAG TPA: methylmalonyl Co-A mutase-associated GTPase MeaB [Polyangiaceae bacterium]|nr:methylmalonyl Co-A mutase-associated GTPase MeaB [Polyangiaceae bacterium]
MNERPSELARGVRAGDRRSLARAITLLESRRADDEKRALELLHELLPFHRRGLRIGVSGPPGVGKSSLLESLGMHLIGLGRRPFVLVVDPSSQRAGGSILGDKTRMTRLARAPEAYVRPSPSGDVGGGISRSAGDVLFACETAGFGPSLVETVGVGQAEMAVMQVVDVLLLLLEPGAGDELTGIKRGLNEWADVVAVNKADGERAEAARRTSAEFDAAFRLLRGHDAPNVLPVSAREGAGVAELWRAIEERHAALEASGALEERRRQQRKAELRDRLSQALMREFARDPARRQALADAERDVMAGSDLARAVVQRLLAGERPD